MKAERQTWLGLKIRMAEYVTDDDTGDEVLLGETWKATLCHLCQYAEWHDVADDGGECTHPWAGVSDCWGFRPKLALVRAQEIEASGQPWDGAA